MVLSNPISSQENVHPQSAQYEWPEDSLVRRKLEQRDSAIAYEDFKKWYWGLQKDFNPVNFNPEQWAKAGKDAGMRYLVFTTKHHDGFAMFDTKESNFKISAGPFNIRRIG